MMFTGWPIVHDPIKHIFVNLHTYMYYPYWSTQGWNNATAEKAATTFYQAIQQGMKLTGYPALVTEGGADWIDAGAVPDAVGGTGGDASYSKTTVHFAQSLVTLFNHNTPRIGWVFWPIGSWAQCCNNGGIYGALDSGGWGTHIAPVPQLGGSILGNTTSVELGQDVRLTGLASGGISPYSYTWDFGDGNLTIASSVHHKYTLGGVYTVSLEVVDSTNVTSISRSQITVNVPLTVGSSNPVINIPTIKTIVVGNPVHFTISAYSKSPRLILLSALSLPQGASFTSIPGNPATGNFSWIPSDRSFAGLYNVMFRAQESGSSGVDIKSVTIQVVTSTTIINCPGCNMLFALPSFALFLTASTTLMGLVVLSGYAILPAYHPRPKFRIMLSRAGQMFNIHRLDLGILGRLHTVHSNVRPNTPTATFYHLDRRTKAFNKPQQTKDKNRARKTKQSRNIHFSHAESGGSHLRSRAT
jgi:hypothetical protein